jgi:hypothetical protein
MLTKNFPDRKLVRKASADKRTEERSKRSAKEQLASLDKTLGVNLGASKERKRLNK